MWLDWQTNPGASTAAQERMAQVWIKYDCNPMKSLVGTVGQGAVFMTFFFALKSLAAAKVHPSSLFLAARVAVAATLSLQRQASVPLICS